MVLGSNTQSLRDEIMGQVKQKTQGIETAASQVVDFAPIVAGMEAGVDRVDPGASEVINARDGSVLFYIEGKPYIGVLDHWNVEWTEVDGERAVPYPVTVNFLTPFATCLAIYNSLPDQTPFILAAQAKAKALGVPLVANGTFRVDGGVQFDSAYELGNAAFLCKDADFPGYVIGSPTGYVTNLRGTFPFVRNLVPRLDAWTGTSRMVTAWNLHAPELHFIGSQNFREAVEFTSSQPDPNVSATGLGHAYNKIWMGHEYDCLRSWTFTTDGEYSWTNQFLVYGGRSGHTAPSVPEGVSARHPDSRHIVVKPKLGPVRASGPVASATSFAIQAGTLNGGQSLTAAQFRLFQLSIVAGTGAGQMRTITAHTTGTTPSFTVDPFWDVLPDATSQFEVARMPAMNTIKFESPTLEGSVAEYHAEIMGQNVVIEDARWETHRAGTDLPHVLYIGPFTKSNTIERGYDAFHIVRQFLNGAFADTNDFIHALGRQKGGVEDGIGLTGPSQIIRRLFGGPVTTFTDAAAGFLQSANKTIFKQAGSTTERLSVNHNTGELNWGPGGVAAPNTALGYGGPDLLAMGAGDSFRVDGTWDGGMLRLGTNRLWVDATGKLRMKNGTPSSDTDGTVVGTQS